MKTYKVIRNYHKRAGRSSRVIKRGLSLEEAQLHCGSPKAGETEEWFDGYEEE